MVASHAMEAMAPFESPLNGTAVAPLHSVRAPSTVMGVAGRYTTKSAGGAAGIVPVKSPDTARLPAASRERTR